MSGVPKSLPSFTEDGLLPPGDYVLTLDEMAKSLLVVGPEDAERYPSWDRNWRGPHYGQLCRIRDEHGHESEFPSAFRRSRTGARPRGIVKIRGGA